MSSMILAWLVVLSTAVLTLEIQRHLLLARILGAVVMVMGWSFLLSSELQLQAVYCAVVYHGLAEGLRQWQRNFPCVLEHHKNRKVVLWLVFWARVYTWGVTLGGIAELTALTKSQDTNASRFYWREAAILAFYHELLEVLVMLYFSDEELPYMWHQRIGHWLSALLVGGFESSERLNAVRRSHLLAGMSPLALVGVLLAVMWLSIEIRWDRIAQASSPTLVTEEDVYDEVAQPEQGRRREKEVNVRRPLFKNTRDSRFS